MRKFIKAIAVGTALMLLAVAVMAVAVDYTIPDSYRTTNGNNLELKTGIPLSLRSAAAEPVNKELSKQVDKKIPMDLLMFGVIPIKRVDVEVVGETKLIPCGIPFGIKMFTDGVVVVGISDVKDGTGSYNPARDAGLKVGDVILSIDGKTVRTNEEVADTIENCGGKPLEVSFRRDNVLLNTKIQPIQSSIDGIYRAGLWVRDSSAGIGTLTFYNPQTGTFGGLGHGICDIDTNELLPLLNGEIVNVTISGVTKGQKGKPGELRGYFNDVNSIGKLYANVETGVYGSMGIKPTMNEALPVAMKQDVEVGPAKILTTVDGSEPQYYDIQIESVNYREDMPSKNMVIVIKDQRLLDKTGGIVQGMSGSPIIQNNKLVGAVTHVFVNEPTKGYGIFAENMLLTAQGLETSELKNAS